MKCTITCISVCVPVYNTEAYLMQCLESIASQNISFPLEILVLSDASTGRDEKGRSTKKIVREFEKQVRKTHKNISVRYMENSQNLVLLETRRRLTEEASGEYIFMLDSDDFLPPDALSVLYETAVKTNADVVQGACTTVALDGKTEVECPNTLHPYEGSLEGHSVFYECFCGAKYRPCITMKLIRRETYLKAFSEIPFIKTNMAEDVLQYFFIAWHAQKYAGINRSVYMYRIGNGITTKKISDLSEWRKVCSTASVFTAIYSWVEEKSAEEGKPVLTEEEMKALQNLTKTYCINNVNQLRDAVVTELQREAREMLCEYWGEEAVQNTERFLAKITSL